MLSVNLPAGPGDYLQRLDYLENQNGPRGIELKTSRIAENDYQWSTACAISTRAFGGTIVWHVPDTWTKRMGFGDFDVNELIEEMSIADWLFNRNFLDAMVMHLGSMRWVGDFPNLLQTDFRKRYLSPFSSAEMLSQIERTVERVAVIVRRFGPERILLENTSLTLAEEVKDEEGKIIGIVNFLGPQIGIFETVLYIARLTGAGVCLDTGHFNEARTLLLRKYGYRGLPTSLAHLAHVPGFDEGQSMRKLDQVAGYSLQKGANPLITRDPLEVGWYIRHLSEIRYIHVDASRSTFYPNWSGRWDGERPLLTDEDAERLALNDMIKIAAASPDHLGMAVENVGIDVYACATPRPTDWEGKRQTFEFIQNRRLSLGF